jgi:recombination protein RecA
MSAPLREVENGMRGALFRSIANRSGPVLQQFGWQVHGNTNGVSCCCRPERKNWIGECEMGKARAKSAPAKKSNDSSGMLDNALGQIEKTFGKGAIMKLNSSDASSAVPGISTGALSLDLALGGRGFPRGRVIELYGPESSGKTTLALHAIASAQKTGGIAAFVDAEHALEPSWARRLGVNLEELLVSQPSYGEEGLQIAEMLIKSNSVDIIVVDSVAALVPKAELDGEIGDSHVGLQARMMSQAMRKLTGAISRSKTTVIFINQIREKIGVMFGSPETTPGGRALKFYSSCRVDVRRIATLKDGDTQIGIRMRGKIVKNKVAPPFRIAEFDMYNTGGISYEADLVDLAVENNIISRSGTWFSYGATKLGQGRDRARLFLEENPQAVSDITKKILELKCVNGAPEKAAANSDSTESEK